MEVFALNARDAQYSCRIAIFVYIHCCCFFCLDGCNADTTDHAENNGISISWPESNIGVVMVPCPCGGVGEDISRNATRECRGDYTSRAVWQPPDVTSCSFTSVAVMLCGVAAEVIQ